MTLVCEESPTNPEEAGAVDNSPAKIWSAPWRILVSPSQSWQELAGSPTWLPGLVAQVVIMLITGLVAFDSASDISAATGLGIFQSLNAISIIGGVLKTTIAVLAVNLLLAFLLLILFLLTGSPLRFKVLLPWVFSGMLPVALGYLYGAVQTAIIRPLASDLSLSISWLIKPYSLGLASFFPEIVAPLSLQWFFASYFDAFGCWAFVCLIIGARYYLGLSISRTLWAAHGLVIISVLVMTGMWRLVQHFLI